MKTPLNDVHQQFADYFESEGLRPYLYLLSKKMSEGHICLNINEIDHAELAAAGYHKIFTPNELKKEPLVSVTSALEPFMIYNDKLYLERYFNYETGILNQIITFIKNGIGKKNEYEAALMSHKGMITNVFKREGQQEKNLTNWPLVSAVTAIMNNFTIITGGPGTGKTTSVAKILSILFAINPGLSVALAAPTGKAAARMAESLKKAAEKETDLIKERFKTLQPSTIHRLLGMSKNPIHFKYNITNPLNYDLVIVDESSMIDVALFSKLLDAIGPDTRLILLGDKDQLASVEAGSLFGDLCQTLQEMNCVNSERAALINSFIPTSEKKLEAEFIRDNDSSPLFQHIIELRTSFRFSDHEGIGRFSKAIINNRIADLTAFFANTDSQVLIDKEYDEKTFENFIEGYEDFIKEPDIATALKKINNLKVLCAVREGERGLHAINKKIERYLQHKNLIKISGENYENRPIMVTKNNYELQVFNGDNGIIRADENGILKVWFEAENGSVKSILPGYIYNSETVYAMTIHKSQGSEFDNVMVVLPELKEIAILTRELLYTAVTRARKKVIIQGTEENILQVANARVHRSSGILERFDIV